MRIPFPLSSRELESTDAAIGVPHLCPTRGAVDDVAARTLVPRWNFFFHFQIGADSGRFVPNRADSG